MIMHFYPEIRAAEDTGSARLAEGLQLEVESDLGLRNMDIEHGKVETIGEESVLPTATKGLGPTGQPEKADGWTSYITDFSNALAAGPSVDVDVIGLSRDDLLLAENERLKAELRSTRAANETLKGDLEQLHTALSIVAASSAQDHAQHQPCSWFGCVAACDTRNTVPQASVYTL